MTITLPPALDALIARKMSSGLYVDTTEVVREALRQMESRESALNWLRQEAAVGFDQLDRGESVEMNRDVFKNHFRNRRQATCPSVCSGLDDCYRVRQRFYSDSLESLLTR